MPAATRTARKSNARETSDIVDHDNWITLAQSRGRPYRFQGTVVAEANGYRPTAYMWHTITLYALASRGYVAHIRGYQKSVDIDDSATLIRANTLSALMAKLEAYSPDSDLASTLDVSSANATSVHAMLHAAELRSALDEARNGYRALLGDFLFELSALAAGA
jgi:hypothetical protein